IQPDERIKVGVLTLVVIPEYHDAKELCSFDVREGKVNITFITDMGRGCDKVKHDIQHTVVWLLENNYDTEMLLSGPYTYYLKNRIRGGWGHLSNAEALQVFVENKTSRLKHLILGHLSGENNTVELVKSVFRPYCKGIALSVA